MLIIVFVTYHNLQHINLYKNTNDMLTMCGFSGIMLLKLDEKGINMTDIKIQVGERLMMLRKSAKMRQSDVAEHIEVSTGAYQSYENGRREAAYSSLIKLSDLFGVSIDYLLCKTDEKQPPSAVKVSAVDSLSKSEKALLSAYVRIDDRSKTALMSIMREISDRYREERDRAEYEAAITAKYQADTAKEKDGKSA